PVGSAKRSVPTIPSAFAHQYGGHGASRLCPPYELPAGAASASLSSRPRAGTHTRRLLFCEGWSHRFASSPLMVGYGFRLEGRDDTVRVIPYVILRRANQMAE